MNLKPNLVAAAIAESCPVEETNPALLPHAEPELVVGAAEWQQATHLLVGTILHKAGISVVRTTPAELLAFSQNHELQLETQDDGTIEYMVIKKVA